MQCEQSFNQVPSRRSFVEDWQGPQETLTKEIKTRQDVRRRKGTRKDEVVVEWTITLSCAGTMPDSSTMSTPVGIIAILVTVALFYFSFFFFFLRYSLFAGLPSSNCSHKLRSELFQRDGRWGMWFDTGWFVHDAQICLPGIADDRRDCMSSGEHCLCAGFRWWEAFERPAGLINRLRGIGGESWGFHRGYCRWLRNSWSIREMIGVEFS